MVNQEQLDALNTAIEKEIKLGHTQVGWKLGFGSPAGMKALGITRPLVGALFDSGEIMSEAEIDLKNYHEPRVEAELAAHINNDIDGDATFDQMKNSVSSFVPGIEFVDFHSPPINPTFVLSENIYQRGWMLGKDTKTGWIEAIDKEELLTSMGHEKWDPFDNIEAIIGTLEDNFDECNKVANQIGRGIKKGDIILLGSVFPPHPINMEDFHVSMFGQDISLRFRN